LFFFFFQCRPLLRTVTATLPFRPASTVIPFLLWWWFDPAFRWGPRINNPSVFFFGFVFGFFFFSVHGIASVPPMVWAVFYDAFDLPLRQPRSIPPRPGVPLIGRAPGCRSEPEFGWVEEAPSRFTTLGIVVRVVPDAIFAGPVPTNRFTPAQGCRAPTPRRAKPEVLARVATQNPLPSSSHAASAVPRNISWVAESLSHRRRVGRPSPRQFSCECSSGPSCAPRNPGLARHPAPRPKRSISRSAQRVRFGLGAARPSGPVQFSRVCPCVLSLFPEARGS